MLGKTILIAFFGLIVGGCASDGKMQSSGSSSTAGGEAVVSSSTTSAGETTSEGKAVVSGPTNQSSSSRNRIAAGVEEETMDTCLAHIPQDATVGQKMLAEQTCRRDFASRR
jgi:predicted kinase